MLANPTHRQLGNACLACLLYWVMCRQGSVYAYKSGKRIEDPFTADTRISE
jgi:hypothetical protein